METLKTYNMMDDENYLNSKIVAMSEGRIKIFNNSFVRKVRS